MPFFTIQTGGFMNLVDSKGCVHSALLELVMMMGIKVLPTISPEELNKILQANWLQQEYVRVRAHALLF